MPELPEVESARQVIERSGLGRVIQDVDDSDTYECRPTGEIIRHRTAGARCPRCGAEMKRATGGSRTTWWWPQEQAWRPSRSSTRSLACPCTSPAAYRSRTSGW